MIRENDPCDDVGRNGWRAWAGPAQAEQDRAELIGAATSGQGLGSPIGLVVGGYAGPVDPAPGADEQAEVEVKTFHNERDLDAYRSGSSLPRDLKIGDRVPVPARIIKISPLFTGAGAPSYRPARNGRR